MTFPTFPDHPQIPHFSGLPAGLHTIKWKLHSAHRISVVDVDSESKCTWTERLVGHEAVLERCFSLRLNGLLICECRELYKTNTDYIPHVGNNSHN